jgi:type I restriction enzyme M protein
MAKNGSIGFEKELWDAADQLRSHMDAAVYKHVALGLLFLKYVNDKFDDARSTIQAEEFADVEDQDEYFALGAFWVPEEARWEGPKGIKANATQDDIGVRLNKAVSAIEAANDPLQGVVPREFANEDLSAQTLAGLISTFDRIKMRQDGEDTFGRVYEYFLGEFARAEGKKGGQFFTPQSVVKTLVAMLEPYKGRIYDPCCGSGGMFIQSQEFVNAHGGKVGQLSIYGQESNPTTWRLTRMNLALHGLDADFGSGPKDTFAEDLHPNLMGGRGADFVLANPPFNLKAWNTNPESNQGRWKYGEPPKNNANYAWLQHILHHLSTAGRAGVVLSNGSLSSQQSGEGEIRRKMVEEGVVDCIVALPSQLFYTTAIPACLWILDKNKGPNHKKEVLFIDAREQGHLINRTLRDLSQDDIQHIADTYHAWRKSDGYDDEAGFCKATSVAEIEKHGFVLTPGRYVEAATKQGGGESLANAVGPLIIDLRSQMERSRELDQEIESRCEWMSNA